MKFFIKITTAGIENDVMEIPHEIEIGISIKKGSILYFDISYGIHNFIVLNDDPPKDSSLFLLCATSLDFKAMKMVEYSGLPEETWVSVTPEECKIFKNITLFNCNKVENITREEILDKMRNKKLKIKKGTISQDLIMKLCNGVSKSPVVEKWILKKLKL
ncbi:MAG: hypothetical protein PHO86_06000 [Bacilli bacterium]|nr:hypothetical protein [Bacilli bacterium]